MWKRTAPAAALAAVVRAFTSLAMASTNTCCSPSSSSRTSKGAVLRSASPAAALRDWDRRPLRPATEMIAFGAGCGGGCDLRTVGITDGSLVVDETLSNGQRRLVSPVPRATRHRYADRCDHQRDRCLLRSKWSAHRRGNRRRPAMSCAAFGHQHGRLLSGSVAAGARPASMPARTSRHCDGAAGASMPGKVPSRGGDLSGGSRCCHGEAAASTPQRPSRASAAAGNRTRRTGQSARRPPLRSARRPPAQNRSGRLGIGPGAWSDTSG
jgi:hypothetical protein